MRGAATSRHALPVLPFTVVDVFTDELLLGNPVAVVHGADGLTDAQMAAVARWTNLSETTFLLAPTREGADYRLRIFTPGGELPFAGHPTLGSARAWLQAGGAPSGAEIVQECGAGLVRVRRDGGGGASERLAFAAPPLVRSGPVSDADLDRITAGLRVSRSDVVDAAWADNGPGWVAVLLADAAAVLAVEPDAAALAGLNVGVVGPHPPGSEADYEVRAFVAALGIAEDPVTGSLNAGIGQWLIAAGRAPSSYTAAQGTRLGRHGRVRVEQRDGDVWVGGATVVGVRGTLALPG